MRAGLKSSGALGKLARVRPPVVAPRPVESVSPQPDPKRVRFQEEPATFPPVESAEHKEEPGPPPAAAHVVNDPEANFENLLLNQPDLISDEPAKVRERSPVVAPATVDVHPPEQPVQDHRPDPVIIPPDLQRLPPVAHAVEPHPAQPDHTFGFAAPEPVNMPLPPVFKPVAGSPGELEAGGPPPEPTAEPQAQLMLPAEFKMRSAESRG